MVAATKKKSRNAKMLLRMLPHVREGVFVDSDNTVIFNAGAFRELPPREIREQVGDSFKEATDKAREAGRELTPNLDSRAFTRDVIGALPRPDMGDAVLERLLLAVNQYRSLSNDLPTRETWRGSPLFPDYDIERHPWVVRYGNVELRVIENFLLEPDALKEALMGVVEKCSDESRMYENVKQSSKLTHDDPDFNLRRLMTNAGFYTGRDSSLAWPVLKDWAERYVSALCNASLSWHNFHAFHYLRIQKALYDKYGATPQYLERPSRQDIYANLAGKEVLFVSPLAHIVNEQITSGRLQKLYRNYDVPFFPARAIPAWISTWPNRPHDNWSETFERTCESVEASYRERPFEVFIASCGCYGLPICDFVRSRYQCATIYIGHASHMLFGLFPNPDNKSINIDMWAKGDLGRHTNMDRIDCGRYL